MIMSCLAQNHEIALAYWSEWNRYAVKGGGKYIVKTLAGSARGAWGPGPPKDLLCTVDEPSDLLAKANAALQVFDAMLDEEAVTITPGGSVGSSGSVRGHDDLLVLPTLRTLCQPISRDCITGDDFS